MGDQHFFLFLAQALQFYRWPVMGDQHLFFFLAQALQFYLWPVMGDQHLFFFALAQALQLYLWPVMGDQHLFFFLAQALQFYLWPVMGDQHLFFSLHKRNNSISDRWWVINIFFFPCTSATILSLTGDGWSTSFFFLAQALQFYLWPVMGDQHLFFSLHKRNNSISDRWWVINIFFFPYTSATILSLTGDGWSTSFFFLAQAQQFYLWPVMGDQHLFFSLHKRNNSISDRWWVINIFFFPCTSATILSLTGDGWSTSFFFLAQALQFYLWPVMGDQHLFFSLHKRYNSISDRWWVINIFFFPCTSATILSLTGDGWSTSFFFLAQAQQFYLWPVMGDQHLFFSLHKRYNSISDRWWVINIFFFSLAQALQLYRWPVMGDQHLFFSLHKRNNSIDRWWVINIFFFPCTSATILSLTGDGWSTSFFFLAQAQQFYLCWPVMGDQHLFFSLHKRNNYIADRWWVINIFFFSLHKRYNYIADRWWVINIFFFPCTSATILSLTGDGWSTSFFFLAQAQQLYRWPVMGDQHLFFFPRTGATILSLSTVYKDILRSWY